MGPAGRGSPPAVVRVRGPPGHRGPWGCSHGGLQTLLIPRLCFPSSFRGPICSCCTFVRVLAGGRAPAASSLCLYFCSESGLELGPSSCLLGVCLEPWNAESFLSFQPAPPLMTLERPRRCGRARPPARPAHGLSSNSSRGAAADPALACFSPSGLARLCSALSELPKQGLGDIRWSLRLP